MWTQIVGKIRLAARRRWSTTGGRCRSTSRARADHVVDPVRHRALRDRVRLRRPPARASAPATAARGRCRSAARPVADFYAADHGALGRARASTSTIRPTPDRGRAGRSRSPRTTSTPPTTRRRPQRVLAAAGAGPAGADRVPGPLRRQGQPGALLLGRRWTSRVHPVLRAAGAAAPRRGAQLRGLGHGRGLLARAEQLRVLARRRRGRRVLLLRLPRSRPASREHPVGPAEAAYSDRAAQQFLLPYEAVRAAPDPDRYLLEFLQSTYEAAADNAEWDREALEDDPSSRARQL